MAVHLKGLWHKSILLSMAFSLLGVTLALAASGDLDTTFSGNGWARTDFPIASSGASGIAIQPDGKIVAAGTSGIMHAHSFALVRYTPDGNLDKTFGDSGRVETKLSGDTIGYDVAVQADGKILLAGRTCPPQDHVDCAGALARYTPAGTLDPTFGEGGKVYTRFGTADNAVTGVALQRDGKIVVGGYAVVDEASRLYNFVVYRYLPNGRLDRTFSGDGKVRIPIRHSFAHALAIQPGDGKIVVVGTAVGDLTGEDIVVVRLDPNGALDKTFSGDGIKRTNINYSGQAGADRALALAIQPNGKIVVAGKTQSPLTPGDSDAVVVRYNSNGTLDNTFGRLLPSGRRSGKLILKQELFTAVVVQPDGKIVLALAGNERIFLVRLKPSGAFDRSFHGEGFVRISLPGLARPASLARQSSDGKYVIGGSINLFDATGTDFLVARVLP